MPRTSILSAALAACLAASVAACGGGGDTPTVVTPPPSAAVAAVEVGPTGGRVRVGRTVALQAAVRDAAGNALGGRTVVWTSSAESVARVAADGATNGVVTGVAPGTVTITASSEGRSAQTTVVVEAPAVGTVTVAPATATVHAGETLALAASVRDDAGTVVANRAVRWTSSAPAVATVDSLTGVVRGIGGGQATISASSEGVIGSATVTVITPVATVTIGGSAADTLEAYDVVPLQATLRDAWSTVLTGRTVRWRTSDPKVATIDSVTGVLTGVDRGTVTITATADGMTGTATRVVVIRYRSLTTGSMHACDIASGGIAWCWGLVGREGRLGDGRTGETTFSTTPVRVAGALRFVQLSTFSRTTCGIDREGDAYCWGSNGWGALGDGSSTSGVSATPVRVAGGLKLRQVSVGAEHACALTTAGQLYCWGYNSDRQFGVASPWNATTPVPAAPGMTFASVTAGFGHTCAVTTTGQGYCWGYDGLGNLGDGRTPSMGNTATTTPTAIVGGHAFRTLSATSYVTCGVTTAGKGYCWGRGEGYRLGNGSTSVTSTPAAVSGGLTFRSIAAGYGAVCGVTTSDEVWCWGSGASGQLGQPVQNYATTPIRAGGSLKAADVSTANVASGFGAYTCAIAADRLTTYCWGRNDAGQLGNGATAVETAVNATPSVVSGQKPLAVGR